MQQKWPIDGATQQELERQLGAAISGEDLRPLEFQLHDREVARRLHAELQAKEVQEYAESLVQVRHWPLQYEFRAASPGEPPGILQAHIHACCGVEQAVMWLKCDTLHLRTTHEKSQDSLSVGQVEKAAADDKAAMQQALTQALMESGDLQAALVRLVNARICPSSWAGVNV